MSELKLIDIYKLTNKDEYMEAVELIEKTIETLEDLEGYYFKLNFFEEQDEMKKTRKWWEKKLAEIKEDFIDYLRNNGDDENV